MYKQLIAVALLSYSALGDNINPIDRETEISEPFWNEELQAKCKKSCEEFCNPNCTESEDPDCGPFIEPVKCDDATQRKCGETLPDLVNHQCFPDDICIPIECDCKLDYSKSPIF